MSRQTAQLCALVARKAADATAVAKLVTLHGAAQLQAKVAPHPGRHPHPRHEAEVVSEVATMVFKTTGPHPVSNVVVQIITLGTARHKPSSAMPAESWYATDPPFENHPG